MNMTSFLLRVIHEAVYRRWRWAATSQAAAALHDIKNAIDEAEQ